MVQGVAEGLRTERVALFRFGGRISLFISAAELRADVVDGPVVGADLDAHHKCVLNGLQPYLLAALLPYVLHYWHKGHNYFVLDIYNWLDRALNYANNLPSLLLPPVLLDIGALGQDASVLSGAGEEDDSAVGVEHEAELIEQLLPVQAEGEVGEYPDWRVVVAVDDAFVEQEELRAAQTARVWIFASSYGFEGVLCVL